MKASLEAKAVPRPTTARTHHLCRADDAKIARRACYKLIASSSPQYLITGLLYLKCTLLGKSQHVSAPITTRHWTPQLAFYAERTQNTVPVYFAAEFIPINAHHSQIRIMPCLSGQGGKISPVHVLWSYLQGNYRNQQ